MGIQYRVIGAFEVRRALGRLGDRSPEAAYRGLVAWSGKSVGIIREGLYGRPGPNRQDGGLYDTMQAPPPRRTPTGGVAEAGSDQPYSARLERGFVGQDSLGRDYDQPAYPWLAPKREALARAAHAAVTAEIRKLIGG